MSTYTDTTPESPQVQVGPGAVTHAKVITILVAKGYLPREAPLCAAEFDAALLAALDAAPPT